MNLPAGVSSTGRGSTDTKIVLAGVSIAYSAAVGNNNISVTAGGHTSNSATFVVDGPYHMVVQTDLTGPCSGCHTTVERDVTYQIKNFSGTAAGVTNLGEGITFTGWSCTQQVVNRFNQCASNPAVTSSIGIFIDSWSLTTDTFTPVGCGDSITDHWQWCAHSPAQTVGTLTGYTHTDKISINGVISPSKMATGTVVPF